jgi:hypothetical protein
MLLFLPEEKRVMFLTDVVGMTVREIVQQITSDIIVHSEGRSRGEFREYVIKFFESRGIDVSNNMGAVEYLVNIIADKYFLAMR